jgi:hypothetical protein
MAFIGSDGNGTMSGSISYLKQNRDKSNRERFGLALAAPISKSSAMGFSIRRTNDKIVDDQDQLEKRTYNQLSAGVTHIISKNVTLGLVFIDPARKIKSDTRAIAGLQYLYEDFITLMLDGGADYNRNLSETSSYKTAIQINIFGDFFFRAGMFSDKGARERGTGAGIGWVQPKLVLDLALKNSTILEKQEINQKNEKVKETSFSLSYRF